MIKHTELRCGNKVYISDKEIPDKMIEATVGEIFYFEVTLECDFGEGEEDCTVEHEDIIPIAISEHWLLRAGFEIVHRANRHYCINDPNGFKDAHKISIFPTVNDQWHIAFSDTLAGYKDYTPTTKIKWVHQLQNLIFALTGEELTFKDLDQ